MTQTEVYNAALEIAANMVLNEGNGLYLEQIAEKMGLPVGQLSECIPDRQRFSAQVSVKVGAKIWRSEGAIFGRVVQSEKYQSLNGASQIKEILMSTFYYSFKGHPDFWRWLYRFEQFVTREHIPPEAMSEYAAQLASFYPIFLQAFEKGLGDGSVRPEIRPDDYYAAVCQALLNLCIKFSSAPVLAGDTAEAGERMLLTVIDMAVHYLKR